MVKLTADEIDEILYLTRINEKAELQIYLSDLSRTHQSEPASIVNAAVEDVSRNTALHYAAANGHVDILSFILGLQKPSMSTTTTTKATNHDPSVSHTDIVNSHTTKNTTRKHSTPTKDQPASFLAARNGAGNTAFHWACLNGHIHAAKALYAAGAEASTLNEAGRDALREAEGADRFEIVEWLMGLKNGGGVEEEDNDEGRDGNGDMDKDEVDGKEGYGMMETNLKEHE